MDFDEQSDFNLLNDNEAAPWISILELEEGSILHGYQDEEEVKDFTFDDLLDQSNLMDDRMSKMSIFTIEELDEED